MKKLSKRRQKKDRNKWITNRFYSSLCWCYPFFAMDFWTKNTIPMVEFLKISRKSPTLTQFPAGMVLPLLNLSVLTAPATTLSFWVSGCPDTFLTLWAYGLTSTPILVPTITVPLMPKSKNTFWINSTRMVNNFSSVLSVLLVILLVILLPSPLNWLITLTITPTLMVLILIMKTMKPSWKDLVLITSSLSKKLWAKRFKTRASFSPMLPKPLISLVPFTETRVTIKLKRKLVTSLPGTMFNSTTKSKILMTVMKPSSLNLLNLSLKLPTRKLLNMLVSPFTSSFLVSLPPPKTPVTPVTSILPNLVRSALKVERNSVMKFQVSSFGNTDTILNVLLLMPSWTTTSLTLLDEVILQSF